MLQITDNNLSEEVTVKMYGLERLLSPYTPDHFMADFWGEKAVHIVGQPRKFEDLFGWRDVEGFLQHGTIVCPQTRLVFEKKILPPKEVSKERVNYWMDRGATLVLNRLQQWHPRISGFTTRLHRDINRYKSSRLVGVNGYVSQPDKQGFDCHYDPHNVFIAQVRGKKSFTIYSPSIKWPLTRDKSHKPPNTPYLECILAEGDVLYIPTGHWHYAVAVEPSIHLTISPDNRTGEDYLRWLTKEVSDALLADELFRKDFPGISPASSGTNHLDDDLESHLAQLQNKVLELFKSKNFVEAFIEKHGHPDDDELENVHHKWFSGDWQARIKQQARAKAALALWEKGSWVNAGSEGLRNSQASDSPKREV